MERLKIILGCFGNALITLLIVNLIRFGIETLQNGLGDSWHFAFKHGAFYSNGELQGIPLGSSKSYLFLLLFFAICLFRNYKKGKLKF